VIGATVSHYRIVEKIGEGGMGDVYRAHDERLDRDVAIKVLPPDFTDDPDRHARFEREAKMLASLSHPNIATLYELEHLDDQHVLVMELLEGESLAERLASGEMPVRKAIDVAVQIARGLAAAHDRGVVHRDLKPGNVFLTHDGLVKILDFGLAQHTDTGPLDEQSESPTVTRQTDPGTVMGTVGYMSPEQVRAEAADPRSDLFSFGAVLYEMVAGRRAFQRDTAAETMTAILREDPPDSTDTTTSRAPTLDRIIRRCLEKIPSDRFQSAHDLAFALEAAATPSSSAVGVEVSPKTHRRGRPAVAALMTIPVLVVAAVAAFLVGRMSVDTEPPRFRDLTFRRGYVESARFAPDGETVIFSMSVDGESLFLNSTRVDAIESRQLDLPPGDVVGISRTGEMALLLNHHRAGSWLTLGTLAKVNLAGGSPRPIVEDAYDGDISPDGEHFAVVRRSGSSRVLEYPIGRSLFSTQGWISRPRISRDGDRIAFIHHPFYGDDQGLIMIADADGTVTALTGIHGGSAKGLVWSPSGDELWFSGYEFGGGSAVWSVAPGTAPRPILRTPMDVRIHDLSVDGRPLGTSDDSRSEILGRLAGDLEERNYSWWSDDALGAISAGGTAFGGDEQSTGSLAAGDYMAFLRRNDGTPPMQLGTGSVIAVSPDARWVFTTSLTGKRTEMTMHPSGAGETRAIDLGEVTAHGSGTQRGTMSLDGRFLAFVGSENGHPPRGYVLDLLDDSVRPVTPEHTRRLVISPDGRHIAAHVADIGIAVVPMNGGSPTPLEGARPEEIPLQWTLDGSSVFVWNRVFPARIYTVAVDGGERELWKVIMPSDPAGVLYGNIRMSPGGEHYLYRFRRVLNRLFLVDGVE
jgi:serine/threonine protein kinase